MKPATILSCILLSFLICSCNNSASTLPPQEENPDIKSDENQSIKTLDSTSIDYYMLQCKQAQPAQEIPLFLCEKYLQPALSKNELYPYLPLDKASYSFGQIAYEDNKIVAITYYYKAVNDLNLLAASFVATYDKATGNFIDNKMIFGSSTFDFQKTKGYNMGLSYKSEMAFVEQENIVFVLHSTEKRFYSKFKKGVQKRQDEEIIKTFYLNKGGDFSS